MKIFILLFISSFIALSSKTMYVNEFDATDYPIVKAKFVAIEDNGNRITELEENLQVFEDGELRESTTLTCPDASTPKPLSTVLAIDRSNSMRKNDFIDIARSAATSYVDLMDEFTSDIAIVGFSDYVTLYSNFIYNKKDLRAIIKSIRLDGGTNYDIAFLDSFSGALTIAEDGTNKRVVIFLTDGIGVGTEDSIVNRAKELNAEVYCVTIGMPAPKILKNISERTGGLFFENITTEDEINDVYTIIFNLASKNSPCEIKWLSNGCTQGRTGELVLLDSIKAEFKYKANKEKLPRFEFTPSLFYVFSDGGASSKIVTVEAINNEIFIDDIISDNPEFIIPGKSGLNLPKKIEKGEKFSFRIEFIGKNSNFNFATYEIIGSSCLNNRFYAAAGSQLESPIGDNLQIKLPNGGEVFLKGTDTTISWKGNLPTDRVTLEFSDNNGFTWDELAGNHTYFGAKWQIPDIISDQCKIRISQDSKESGGMYLKVNTDDANVHDISWQNEGTFVALAGSDGIIRKINSVTGDTSIVHNEHLSGATSVSWGPLGLRLVSADSTGRIIIWNTLTNKLENEIQDTTIVNVVRWDPDDKYIASGGEDKLLKIWNVITGQLERVLPSEHTKGINDIRWFNSGLEFDENDRLVSCGKDSVIVVWNEHQWRRYVRFEGYHRDVISGVRFSQDGRYVVSGARDKTFAIWDIFSPNTPIYEDKLHTGPIMDVEWLAKDNIVLSTGVDGNILVRQMENDFREMDLIFKYDDIWTKSSLAASPDGARFVAGNWGGNNIDGNMRFYSIDTFTFMQDESDSTFSIIDFQLKGNKIDMGEVIINNVKDSLVENYLNLTSILPITIDSLRIANDLEQVFEINSIDNFELNQSTTYNIQISFTPKLKKSYKSDIVIYTANNQYKYSLTGEGITPFFENQLIDFNEVLLNESVISTFALRNNYDFTITIDSIRQVGPDNIQFEYKGNQNSFQIQKNQELKNFPIKFAPNTLGKANTFLKVYYNGSGSPTQIRIIGTGVSPEISSDKLTFKDLRCNQIGIDTLTISNPGFGELKFNNIQLIGPDKDYFKIQPTLPENIPHGNDLKLSITFTPNGNREYNASLSINSNAVNVEEYLVELSGKELETKLSFSNNNFNFSLDSEDISATLTEEIINQGETELNWDYQFPIVIGTNFIIHTIEPKNTIVGGKSDIIVEFLGGKAGTEYTEKLFFTDECNQDYPFNLFASVSKNAPKLLGENFIDLGTLICENSNSYTLNLQSQINDSYIGNIYFSDYQNLFSILNGPNLIKKDENQSIALQFNSENSGTYFTNLIVEYGKDNDENSKTFSTEIQIIKHNINFEIEYTNSNNIIDLEIKEANQSPSGTFSIKNNGDYEIDWSGLNNFGNLDIISITPLITPVNESSIFSIKDETSIIDTVDYELTSICNITKSLKVGVFTNLIMAIFDLPVINANIGGDFDLPIMLSNSSNINEISGFNFTLKYNPTLMYPISQNNIKEKRVGEIDLEIPIEYLLNNFNNSVRFKALWGNDSTTTISFLKIEPFEQNKKLEGKSNDGLLRILDLCHAGGTRLFINSGTLEIENFSPNPFNDISTIILEASKEMYISIKIYDIFGIELNTIFNGELNKGINSININSNDYANGIYFLQIHYLGNNNTRKIIISN